MKIRRQRTLVGILVIATMAMVTEFVAVPQVLRIALGILLVFFLPGFTIMRAAFPSRDREFSPTELMLASLGISLAVTICMAVLLAALPVGLTRSSISIAIGGSTAIVAIYAWFRGRFEASRQANPGVKPTGVYSRNERY
jgi:uncharacterized membrane protein